MFSSLLHYEPSSDDVHFFFVCGSAKVVTAILSLIVLCYLRYKRSEALNGCTTSARSLILPVYEPLIIAIGIASICEASLSVYHTWWGFDPNNQLMWAVYEFIRDGFPILFLQRSVSTTSLIRAAALTTIPISYGILCGSLLPYLHSYAALMFTGGVAICYLIIASGVIIRRRESVLPYCLFMATYRLLWAIFYFIDMGYLLWLYYPILCLIGLMELPLTMMWYITLLLDTNYWRSGGQSMPWKKQHNTGKYKININQIVY